MGNVSVKLNTAKIARLKKASITALEQSAEALHTEIVQKQVVPFDTGNLQNESMFVDNSKSSSGVVKVCHATPYARRIYFHPEYNFKTDSNPNAKGEWFKDWIDGMEKDFAKKAYAKLYKQLGGL